MYIYIYMYIHPRAESFDTQLVSEETINIYRREAERPPDPFYVASVAEQLTFQNELVLL